MALQIDSRRVGRIAVLKCNGRIVAGNESTALQEHVKKLQPEYNQFVLHMGDVQFVDSTGLGLLVRILCGVRSVRGDLKLCAVPENIQSVLQLTKIASMFDMHPEEDSALTAFGHHTALGAQPAVATEAVLCIEKSSDLLALLREVLRRAGYEPLTTTNVSDAMVLLKSARPKVAILGPGVLATGTFPIERFKQTAAGIPVIEIAPQFATCEPSEAANEILTRVQGALGAKAAQA